VGHFAFTERELCNPTILEEITDVQFAEEVLKTEGMIAEYEKKWMNELAGIYLRFHIKAGLNKSNARHILPG